MPNSYRHNEDVPRHADAVVIGNGSIGLALAKQLLRVGANVVVVGPARRNWGASAAAGAMNGCFGEVTRELLASPFGRKKVDLDVRANAAWDRWVEEICAEAGADPRAVRPQCGTTVLLNTVGSAEIDSLNFEAILSTLRAYEAEHEILDERQIDWIRPLPTARPLRGVHIADEHCVDTSLYLPALEKAYARAGGVLLDGLVRAIEIGRGGRPSAVVLEDGERISCGRVVLAAGARSTELLESALPEVAPHVPGMVSGYGISVLLDAQKAKAPPSVMRTPNRAFACGLHAVPRTSDTIYLGATNIVSDQPQTQAAISDLNFLLDCALRQLHTDLHGARLAGLQVGNRPIPIDGFPLIGQVEDTGLWMLTGTYRDGFHQSPLLAIEIADRICGRTNEPFLPEFAPVRRPICARERESVVEECVTHMLATGFEYDWKVPVEWPARIERHLRLRYAEFAEELHPTFTPPAEILAATVGNAAMRAKLDRYYAAYSR